MTSSSATFATATVDAVPALLEGQLNVSRRYPAEPETARGINAVESPVPETLTVSDEAALDPPATTVPLIVAPPLDGEDGEPPLHATAAIASPQHSPRKTRVMGAS